MRYTTTDGPSKALNAIQDGSLGDKMGITELFPSCPECGLPSLHVDTGSILDFESGLLDDPIFFCTSCGYDSGSKIESYASHH